MAVCVSAQPPLNRSPGRLGEASLPLRHFCGGSRWRCGILAANIVGACGTVCGNGRGWLRRSCGKISSKPAASVVGQPLTHVRGKASPLFSWVPSECAPTTNHALFWPLGVGCWLRRKRAGTFVAGCCCRASLAESVAYALSGSARPHCDCLPRDGPQSIALIATICIVALSVVPVTVWRGNGRAL